MAEDVDYLAVASMTDGMVGAELANIVEVAAINMMRDSRTEVIPPICSLSLADSYSSCILHVVQSALLHPLWHVTFNLFNIF